MSGEIPKGNVNIRVMKCGKGERLFPPHKHNFDHVLILMQGSVLVKSTLPDGREIEATKDRGSYLLIRKGVAHEGFGLEDYNEGWCIFAHRDPQTGNVLEEWNGWPGATI